MCTASPLLRTHANTIIDATAPSVARRQRRRRRPPFVFVPASAAPRPSASVERPRPGPVCSTPTGAFRSCGADAHAHGCPPPAVPACLVVGGPCAWPTSQCALSPHGACSSQQHRTGFAFVPSDESGVDNFSIRSKSELCGCGEEFLIYMQMWII